MNAEPDITADRWSLDTKSHSIVWSVSEDKKRPHEDHLEMSGQKVSLIVRYGVDQDGRLTLLREVIWPMLRLQRDDVRGYLRRIYGSEIEPQILRNGQELTPGPLARVRFDGVLTLEHKPQNGLAVTRTLFPTTEQTQAFERWEVRNTGREAIHVAIASPAKQESETGVYGEYLIEVRSDPPEPMELQAGAALAFGIQYCARRASDPPLHGDVQSELRKRRKFVETVWKSLRLETPDPTLNLMFDFARLRASESIFSTRMGRMHSPGGGRYYGGVWANDQAEYSGPFFPFTGNRIANEAALNAYRIFARAMTPDYRHLPSSFEVEGDVAWSGAGDRGDAAMIAYGASRFALARGDLRIAKELWPAIVWCLEFCRRKTNAQGVVESDSDELEGRFPAGKANLSTSTLAYGAYSAAANLACALEKSVPAGMAEEYDRHADALRQSIERYFGAVVEGFSTYRYYDGNTRLRAWICLPLTMGILDRKAGTVQALFSPALWTADGLATEAGDKVFWDRSTLYALRGVFAAGETEMALRYLQAYSHRRLLGDHVPYAVEAFPEGGQAHLSAESALYCRVVTEGLFGITPTGFRSFRCTPRLPQGWPAMQLRDVRAFGRRFDLIVRRENGQIVLVAEVNGQPVTVERKPDGEQFLVSLP